jgi:shikimate kinase
LLPDTDATATLTRLAAERESYYAAVADAIVDSNDHPVEKVAAAVLEEYARCRG